MTKENWGIEGLLPTKSREGCGITNADDYAAKCGEKWDFCSKKE
jgi:hypothetical protein